MEGRGKYVHPLINLIVFMGQRVHISAARIMRAWNKVIHCIPFKIMWVWAKDQEKRENKAQKIKRLYHTLASWCIESSLNAFFLKNTKSLKNALCLHCRNEFRLSFPKKQGSTEFKSLISYENPVLKINKLIFSRSDWLVREWCRGLVREYGWYYSSLVQNVLGNSLDLIEF